MPRVTEVYAFIGTGKGPDDEGIVLLGNIPLVNTDVDALTILKPVAQKLASRAGKEIRLVKFVGRVEVETIKPLFKAG